MAEETAARNFDGVETFCRTWKPASNDPKCLVFISHGFGEHCGRYTEVIPSLLNENILVFSHDHKGFGRSGGHRAWVGSVDADLVAPIKRHIEEVAAKFPGNKIFLYGHSMGGLATARIMELYPDLVNGAIMEAPFLGLDVKVPDWQVKVLRVMGRFFGSITLPKLDPRLLSRDVKVVEDYSKDPLVWHDGVPLRTAKELFDTQVEVNKNAALFLAPLLLCHGDADTLSGASASRSFFQTTGSFDKTFKLFPGGFHQLRSELDDVRKPFLDTIVEWINARC